MKPIAPAVTAILALLAAATAAAEDRSASDVDMTVVGSDADLTELPEQLRDILASPPLPLGGQIQIARAGRFFPGDLFSLARPGANRPAAWIVVESGIVHIRAAGAGRAQFVFRDITISQPMTDLDRERVGQTLRSALTVVIEGSPGSIGRGDAQRAVDFEERPPAVPVSPVASAAALLTPAPPARQLHVGGFIQMARIGDHLAYAPGVIGSIEWTRVFARPSVWATVMNFWPDSAPSKSTAVAYGFSLRGGGGAAIPRVRWLRLEVGAGFDWLRSGYTPQDAGTSVFRFALRFGPTDRFGIRSSLTLSAEHVNTTFWTITTQNGAVIGVDYLAGTEGVTSWRPGLTLELWWL